MSDTVKDVEKAHDQDVENAEDHKKMYPEERLFEIYLPILPEWEDCERKHDAMWKFHWTVRDEFGRRMFNLVRGSKPEGLEKWINEWVDNRSTLAERQDFVRSNRQRVEELKAKGLDVNEKDGDSYEQLLWYVPMLRALFLHPDFRFGNIEKAIAHHEKMRGANPEWWELVTVKGFSPDDPSAGQKRKRD